jgi:hypothetical protein
LSAGSLARVDVAVCPRRIPTIAITEASSVTLI